VRSSAFALFLLLPAAACSQPQPAPPEVKDVWTRDTVGGTANAAVFMTITANAADRLVAASTPAAKTTDLMTMAGGSTATEMTYVKAIDLPAGKPVSLNPTGLHVWLAGLNQPLKAGQTFPLSLRFEKAGARQVTVSVIAPAAMPPMAGMKM
jgi:copper(I)-binding protein